MVPSTLLRTKKRTTSEIFNGQYILAEKSQGMHCENPLIPTPRIKTPLKHTILLTNLFELQLHLCTIFGLAMPSNRISGLVPGKQSRGVLVFVSMKTLAPVNIPKMFGIWF